MVQNVITLVTDKTKYKLDETNVNNVIKVLEKNKAKVAEVVFLAKDEAVDIFFEGLSVGAADILLRNNIAFDKDKTDMVIQPVLHRKKKILICDMDSTIIEQECIDELADELGLKAKVSAITKKAMEGKINFEGALKARVTLLKGLEEEKLEFVYKNKISFTSGARQLVETMRHNKAYCVLVSGGFSFFTSCVCKDLGFSAHKANKLEVVDGKLTGKVMMPILGKKAKLETIHKLMREFDVNQEDVMAIGDGANDIPMLKGAGLGIAYHAKTQVQAQVTAKINFCDLKSVLFVQGYKEKEILG